MVDRTKPGEDGEETRGKLDSLCPGALVTILARNSGDFAPVGLKSGRFVSGSGGSVAPEVLGRSEPGCSRAVWNTGRR